MIELVSGIVSPIESENHRDGCEDSWLRGDLLYFAKDLKKGLNLLRQWVLLYPLSTDPIDDLTLVEDLNHALAPLQLGYSLLASYIQRSPKPVDFISAIRLEKMIEILFRFDLGKETLCKTKEYGLVSWGDLIHPARELEWSAKLIHEFFTYLPLSSWMTVANLLAEALSALPSSTLQD